MVLVIRLVKKIAERVNYGQQLVEKERKFSQTMTMAHIGLVLGYTVVSIMAFNIRATGAAQSSFLHEPTARVYRVQTCWTVFGGVSDIFLSCMIWFIHDEEGTPTIFRDERHNSTYAILDLIKPKDSFRSSV